MDADTYQGTLPRYLYYGTGWEGDYEGYHYLVAAGTIPPTEAQQSDPSTWKEQGGIVLVRGPLENAPLSSPIGMPSVLPVPSTPGPLRVIGVKLPDVLVAGPEGARYSVSITRGSVTAG